MLRRILPTVIDTKYNIIYYEERSLAKAVAAEVIPVNPITVWELMIPFIFFYNIMRFKRAREVFTLNFMFTKKLALEAALNMIKKGQSKQNEIAQIEDKTNELLAADKKGVYSEKVRQKQLKEIDLLIDHYLKLLEAEGKDYLSLIRNAYTTRENYARFLHQLKQAEKEVNRAALQLQAVGNAETAHTITSEMEKTTDRIRQAEAAKFFA